MKPIYLLFVLFLFSCSASKTKFSEQQSDYTQDLAGKIKQINIKSYQYSTKQHDSILRITTGVIFFDKKNRVIKEIENSSNFNHEMVYKYENNLLKSTHSTIKGTTDIKENLYKRSEYVYDRKKNIIEYRQFQNDKLGFLKTMIYDSKNNVVKATYLHPNAPGLDCIEKHSIDYTNITSVIHTTREEKPAYPSYLKLYYNKKGFLIKTETVNTGGNEGKSGFQTRDYDAKGNLTRHVSYKNGKITASAVFKNEYDSKGNIIVREKYLDGKILEKTVNEIVYW